MVNNQLLGYSMVGFVLLVYLRWPHLDGKGGKQRTSILPKPALEALEAHLSGRDDGYAFEGRDHSHITTSAP